MIALSLMPQNILDHAHIGHLQNIGHVLAYAILTVVMMRNFCYWIDERGRQWLITLFTVRRRFAPTNGARVEPTSGSRREAPSNPRWSVTPAGRLRRPVLASPPPTTARETPTFLGRAAGPLRAG